MLYCQYLVTTKTKVDLLKNTAILDKVMYPNNSSTIYYVFFNQTRYHINETTAKKFIEMHVDQSEALLAHFRGLLDLAGYVDLDKRKKLLRFIAYLPPSKETIEVCIVFPSCFQLTYFQMLIVNFLQTDDVLLQASAERVLNLNINKFMDIAGGIQLHYLLVVKINSFSFFFSLFSPFPFPFLFFLLFLFLLLVDSVVDQLMDLYNLLLKNFRISETLLAAKVYHLLY